MELPTCYQVCRVLLRGLSGTSFELALGNSGPANRRAQEPQTGPPPRVVFHGQEVPLGPRRSIRSPPASGGSTELGRLFAPRSPRDATLSFRNRFTIQ